MRIIKDSNSLLPQRKCGSLDIHLAYIYSDAGYQEVFASKIIPIYARELENQLGLSWAYLEAKQRWGLKNVIIV